MRIRAGFLSVAAVVVASNFAGAVGCFAQVGTVDPKLYSDMKWREIGPLRAGRTRALTGVPSQPATFLPRHGEWRRVEDNGCRNDLGTDLGFAAERVDRFHRGPLTRTRTSSMWRAARGLQRPDLSTGDGVYKSTDAGATWTHLPGLRDGQQMGQIAVDPRDPNKVFVAVTGHPYGPNKERGALSFA